MAMTFAAYAVPDAWQRPVAAALVVVLRAGQLRRHHPHRRPDPRHRRPGPARPGGRGGGVLSAAATRPGSADAGTAARRYGVLQSAGLLFFAFAGYARIATLGEEVRDPARVDPARDPGSPWPARWSSTPSSGSPLLTRARTGGPGRVHRSRSPTRSPPAAGTGPSRRPGRAALAAARRAARPGRRARPYLARHGPRGRPAALAGRGASAVPGAAPRRAERRRRGRSCWCSSRPARRDRLLVVRRAPLLLRRQRGRAGAGSPSSAGTRGGSRCSGARAAWCSSRRCRGRRSSPECSCSWSGSWCGWCGCAPSPTVGPCWIQRRPSTVSRR